MPHPEADTRRTIVTRQGLRKYSPHLADLIDQNRAGDPKIRRGEIENLSEHERRMISIAMRAGHKVDPEGCYFLCWKEDFDPPERGFMNLCDECHFDCPHGPVSREGA